jgi:hypothetical protein
MTVARTLLTPLVFPAALLCSTPVDACSCREGTNEGPIARAGSRRLACVNSSEFRDYFDSVTTVRVQRNSISR